MTTATNSTTAALARHARAVSQLALEQSIFWQEQVIKQSRDPVQIARCKAAVARLQDQLKGATA